MSVEDTRAFETGRLIWEIFPDLFCSCVSMFSCSLMLMILLPEWTYGLSEPRASSNRPGDLVWYPGFNLESSTTQSNDNNYEVSTTDGDLDDFAFSGSQPTVAGGSLVATKAVVAPIVKNIVNLKQDYLYISEKFHQQKIVEILNVTQLKKM